MILFLTLPKSYLKKETKIILQLLGDNMEKDGDLERVTAKEGLTMNQVEQVFLHSK